MVNTKQHSNSNNNQSELFVTEACDSITVELASPWRRIAAYLINKSIYYFIIFIGLQIYNATFDFESESLGQNIVLPFQLWFLSDYRSTEPVSSIWGLLLVQEETHDLSSIILYIILPVAIFALWQIIQMSMTGQSIGKRIMGIKVIGINGQNQGFAGTVLLREICFYIIAYIIEVLAYIFIKHFTLPSHISFYDLLLAICLIMLFGKSYNQRTIQDYLAKTIVIKAKK